VFKDRVRCQWRKGLESNLQTSSKVGWDLQMNANAVAVGGRWVMVLTW